MPARLIDGVAIGDTMRAELMGEIAALKARGVTPGLAAVLVGDNPASQTYVRMKAKACDQAGLYHETIQLPQETGEPELLALIRRLNADARIHGILVQLPLPSHINSQRVLRSVDPRKDVDGFHPENVGKVAVGDRDRLPARDALRRAAAAAPQRVRDPGTPRRDGGTLGDRRAARWRRCCCRTVRAATRR